MCCKANIRSWVEFAGRNRYRYPPLASVNRPEVGFPQLLLDTPVICRPWPQCANQGELIVAASYGHPLQGRQEVRGVTHPGPEAYGSLGQQTSL